MQERFDEVAFTAGNHDIWVQGPARKRQANKLATGSPFFSSSSAPLEAAPSEAAPSEAAPSTEASAQPSTVASRDSLEQLAHVYSLCSDIGVRTAPFWIRRPPPLGASAAPLDLSDPPELAAPSPSSTAPGHDVLLVPLQSWYHASWDQEVAAGEEISESALHALWADMRYCSWPESHGPTAGADDRLARHFADMNKSALSRLLRVLPPRLEGRAPPARRLNKAETYNIFHETPNPTDLWSEAEPDQYFTKRHADAYLAEQARGASNTTLPLPPAQRVVVTPLLNPAQLGVVSRLHPRTTGPGTVSGAG